MWKQLVEQYSSSAAWRAPVSESQLDLAEAELSVRFPEELRSCLLESDGIEAEYGLQLVWPLARIVDDNKQFRNNSEFKELYMPFDCLLFFGDAGNGDQFAFLVLSGQVRKHDVFVWNHEDDSRSWVAPSLARFLEWWLSGELKI